MPSLRRYAAVALSIAFLGVLAPAPKGWRAHRRGIRHFLYAASFFYARTPRSQWAAALRAYRAMGINTIDLYIPWNFQEPRPGDFDFTGRTNPRRDLRGLFALIVADGFRIIVRPGPVIRNEWRNGGYPAWLLVRRAYRMPLHDILQGRYPATATLQNAHADDAAKEWLANADHLRAVHRWFHALFAAIAPWSNSVAAVALDDDQGAYIDNDTWPAPHWHAYIRWLQATVRGEIGPNVPLFVNTYQSKVPAAIGVWAWGNWYQSDAYRIGTHDLAQLIFSTALLQTQPHRAVMQSEFQAGWLQGANETHPRPAAPENTTIALHQLLQLGAHAIVNFPVQDTMNPAGWEAPWANALYAWDAALSIGGVRQARYAPTADFGALVQKVGARQLARLRPDANLAIAWPVSAYPPGNVDNARIAAFAAATIRAFMQCRALALTCRAVDLRFAAPGTLARYRALVLPPIADEAGMLPAVRARLARYRRHGALVRSPRAARARGIAPTNGGIEDATLLLGPHRRRALFDQFNLEKAPRATPRVTLAIGPAQVTIPAHSLAAGAACDWRIDRVAPSRAHVSWVLCTPPLPPAQPMNADNDLHALVAAIRSDGTPTYVLRNARLRVIVSADAGARSFVLEDRRSKRNLATSIGLFRDDVASPLPPSKRDYIAAFTHPFEAGTFNRRYRCVDRSGAAAQILTCRYRAPDLGANPVDFTKTFILDPQRASLRVLLECSTRCVSISAFTAGGGERIRTIGGDPLVIPSPPGSRLLELRYRGHAEIDIGLPGAP
ncbi:MAG: beta-galactosidase [Candidatus Baltobacteraceae bacterium]